MAPTDAIIMDNFFPDLKSVRLRGGYASHASAVGSVAVETLMVYEAGSQSKMIAAAGTALYNVTSAGAASSLATGLANEGRWSYVNFNSRLGMVNGATTPRQFNGTTISTLTISGTGLTSSTLIGVASYRSRTYWWKNNSQDFWYSSVDTLGGVLTKFPLSRVGSFGGNIKAIGNWSQGGGSPTWGQGGQLEQLLTIVMSSGEVIVYQGSNPGDATDFALVGVFKVGRPLGDRCLVKVAGDLILMTVDGFVPMSAISRAGQFSQDSAISDKIRKAITEATGNYASNEGWEAVYYPRGNRVLFNVPLSSTQFQQYVINTVSGSWARFVGQNAYCWTVYNNDLYFGGVGAVYKADTGTADVSAAIDGSVVTSYSQIKGGLAHVKAVRPTLSSTGAISFGIAISPDFRQVTPPSQVALGTSTGTWDEVSDLWDLWDEDWDEGTGDLALAKWFIRGSVGYRHAITLNTSSSSGLEWTATDLEVQPIRGRN